MSLQEHAATVIKLVQIAYSDLPQANRERYTYDAFHRIVKGILTKNIINFSQNVIQVFA